MFPQNNQGENNPKWYQLEKTSPEKYKKIHNTLSILVGVICLIVTLPAWQRGGFKDAMLTILNGSIMIALLQLNVMRLKKLPPEEYKKIPNALSVFYGIIYLVLVLLAWHNGNFKNATPFILNGFIIIAVLQSNVIFYKKLAEKDNAKSKNVN